MSNPLCQIKMPPRRWHFYLVEASGMCLPRLMAIHPSFAACGSGPPLRLMRIGVQINVPRTFICRTPWLLAGSIARQECDHWRRECVCLALRRSSHPSPHAAQDRYRTRCAIASQPKSPGLRLVEPAGSHPPPPPNTKATSKVAFVFGGAAETLSPLKKAVNTGFQTCGKNKMPLKMLPSPGCYDWVPIQGIISTAIRVTV